jgi:hypothetical protein
MKNIKSNYHCKIDFVIVEISTVNQGTLKLLQKILSQSKLLSFFVHTILVKKVILLL